MTQRIPPKSVQGYQVVEIQYKPICVAMTLKINIMQISLLILSFNSASSDSFQALTLHVSYTEIWMT